MYRDYHKKIRDARLYFLMFTEDGEEQKELDKELLNVKLELENRYNGSDKCDRYDGFELEEDTKGE